MTLHLEALSERQLSLLPMLGSFARPRGLYLGGGTAVALHLGHRRSVDFDWFSEAPIEDPLGLAGDLRAAGMPLESVQVARGTLHGAIGGVRVSFLEYRYPLLVELLTPDAQNWLLAPLEDLACMKLAAAAQRGSRKDFIDVYAIATLFRPLPDLLDLFRRKYATSEVAHVLKGLTYFDDAEGEPPLYMLQEMSWDHVKACLSEWTRQLFR